ncbi:MAG: molybdopterin-synthase adenylyltransferase MoeB [Candidatus Eremiobacteraeota bacterium]|nr:molybdopterin-synthase adenylyltransferase MoeB [Candidatus Eremiobacteraeota bacterium]
MVERTTPALSAGNPLRRYSRHLLIPEIGLSGQQKLARARVLVVGAGGLGSPVLQYLAAAGVGRLGIVDDDTVDLSNLQRQVIYAQADIGRSKAAAAAERVAALNPQVGIDPFPIRFDPGNARELVRLYDVVIDATDTFGARYLINDACRLEGKPDVYGSIFRFDGQVSVFAPQGPCYRCLFPEPPPSGSVPSCAEGGVLGVLAGLVGTWQANEALKLVLGIGEPLAGRLLLVDALAARLREVTFGCDPECPLHGSQPTISDVAMHPAAVATPFPRETQEIDAAALDDYLEAHPVTRVLDVREVHERALGPAPQSIAIPASALAARLHELDSAREYVVACRIGAKSAWAAELLADAGFRRLRHLHGGLLAYAVARPNFEFF